MIRTLSAVLDDQERGRDPGPAVTVRCRVRSDPMPGESAGEKTVYLIDDPYDELDERAALSFWAEEPSHRGLERTAPYVLSTLAVSADGSDGVSLRRGEELLVRGVPNRRGGDGAFYLNVTSFVIREPDRLISKSKLRTQDRCPREYYLRYVKRVYPGDKFDAEPYERAASFRGRAVHKLTERAFEEYVDRFRDGSWTPELVESFCEDQFADEFGFQQALLVLSGAGLDVRDHVVEAVTKLFTDSEFRARVQSADEIEVEQFLTNEYGYAGRVDILLDGTPYDIKTTRDPDEQRVRTHGRQIKLYLFALLLDRIDPGESFREAVATGLAGYLLYPNVDDDAVRFERVELTMDDVREFLHARNDVIETGDAFAPPSTYNRDCEDCSFAVEEWVSGRGDSLPPACTYHCQNERRWPCYETIGGELTTQCSLFDDCDQWSRYRDPDVIDHYESVRVAFQQERTARATAKRALDRFDDDLLVDAGYRVTGLECVGAGAAGTVVRFETMASVVPAFDPGAVVELQRTDGSQSDRAVYVGREDGQFLFNPLEPGVDVADYLGPDAVYEAVYEFGVDAIDERHLPYLDFAQRRSGGDPLVATGGDRSTEDVPDTVSPSDVSTYLDRDRIFVDLPVHTARDEVLADVVRDLTTAAYPHPDGSGVVPDEGRRALVLGATPALAELAATARPEGEHYRLDGTGGPRTIRNEDGYHEIQSRLLDSRSLVSTVQQATGVDGPGGVREFFHRLEEGSFGDRDHSENFFDVLVVLGAERLTEPEFHFLSDLADRVVAVGDSRRGGPRLLSRAATEAGLDVYFAQEFDRYQSFPTDEAVGLQLAGEAPPALRAFYRDEEGPLRDVDGDLRFLTVSGDEEVAIETVEFETSVPAANGSGLRLVFDVTDTPLSPMAARELLEDRIELDATALREKEIVVLDDESLFLRAKEQLDGEGVTHHQVVIRALASELPQFSRALLSNRIAEQIIAQVAVDDAPDVIVTPFERHGARIARRLDEAGVDVPVRRPEELDGTIVDDAVVSLATANEAGIVRPPLDDPTVLYSLLASGRNVTLVGNERTLRSKDVFDVLIESATEY